MNDNTMNASIDTVWSSKGYRIPRDLFLEKKLTVYSTQKSDYPGPKPKVKCYLSSEEYTYIPYYFGELTFGIPKRRFCQEIFKTNLNFNGNLRPYQEDTISKTLEHFKKVTKGGIWSIGTGMGKTVMALALVQKLGVKTIIIVHKKVLLEQWKERIEYFLPDARIGIIQGTTNDVEDKDIILGMVQTLTRKEHPRELFKDIGMIICDEVHTICCQTFSTILFKIQARYRLGLSATPTRKDGFDKVLFYHIGPTIIDLHQTLLEPEIHFLDGPENLRKEINVELNRQGKTNLPKLITDLADNKTRNKFIIDLILEKLKEDRKILILSDRVAQCEQLKVLFNESDSNKIADTFIGKMKKHELEESLKADVIFATWGIFKEGIDCPELDTLIFATPKSDIVQAVGRILRQKNKNLPQVVDIIDQLGPLKAQYYNRLKYYKQKEYKIIRKKDDENNENNTNNINEDNNNKQGKCIIIDDDEDSNNE